ncbi:MAG: MarR family transcriptional regulator [Spirochaetota bacterium]|nr:MarR family transcriptional regulator [Spirochaetota bacterium]
MEIIDPVDCPYYLITRTSLLITSVLKKGFTSANIDQVKPAYLGVLMSLWRHEDSKKTTNKISKNAELKINELARMVNLEPSSMTGLIDRMERDGLIIRQAFPGDRRAQHISLTENGHSVRESVMKVVDETLTNIFRNISEDSLKSAKEVLRNVLANNQEI